MKESTKDQTNGHGDQQDAIGKKGRTNEEKQRDQRSRDDEPVHYCRLRGRQGDPEHAMNPAVCNEQDEIDHGDGRRSSPPCVL